MKSMAMADVLSVLLVIVQQKFVYNASGTEVARIVACFLASCIHIKDNGGHAVKQHNH